MTTLFISDLHLDPELPEITRLFGDFIDGEARGAEALYILGDLFVAWIGDDDPWELGAFVIEKLRGLTDAGVPVFFQHGNRDTLIGHDFARRTGATLLQEEAIVRLYGEPVLLMHGDTLCTGDTKFMETLRIQLRNPQWHEWVLSQTLEFRSQLAKQARAESKQYHLAKQAKAGGHDGMIADVSDETVRATLARYGVNTLIHGHTHRPADHGLTVDGRACRRIVLGDWFMENSIAQGSVVRADANGIVLSPLPM